MCSVTFPLYAAHRVYCTATPISCRVEVRVLQRQTMPCLDEGAGLDRYFCRRDAIYIIAGPGGLQFVVVFCCMLGDCFVFVPICSCVATTSIINDNINPIKSRLWTPQNLPSFTEIYWLVISYVDSKGFLLLCL